MSSSAGSLSAQAAAIALIYDRTALFEEPICSGFLVGNKLVATVASAVSPFAKNPRALKVTFPKSGLELGVHNIHFHKRFDRRLAAHTVERGTLTHSPEAALQKFNCCILQLEDGLEFLQETEVEEVSRALRFPLNLDEDGFRGSLSEIELADVIQMLNNGRKHGILYVCDDLTRPVAQIFCSEGQILGAKYRNLFNEMAFYQIVEKKLLGRFAFYPCRRPSWLTEAITDTPAKLLIEAHRRLDELIKIRGNMTPGVANFARAEKYCDLESISLEFKRPAERLWQVLDAITPAEDLWLLVGADDYTIYRSLYELYRSKQIVRIHEGGTQELHAAGPIPGAMPTIEVAPLRLGTNLSMQPYDQIVAVSIDPMTRRTKVRAGALLGAIDAYDSWHLLHEVPLLPSASGIPIFKNDYVMGMHCGTVPSLSTTPNSPVPVQQMLWVNAVVELKNELIDALPALRTPDVRAAGVEAKPADGAAAGCKEVASLSCPSCGRKTFRSARTCATCGFDLMPVLTAKVTPHGIFDKAVPIATAIVLVLVASAAIALSSLPEANMQSDAVAIVPSQPWISPNPQKWNGTHETWESLPDNPMLKSGDALRFKIEANKAAHIYILYKGSGNKTASLLYPPDSEFTNELGAGNSMIFPTDIQYTNHMLKNNLSIDGPSGSDLILFMASPGPLHWLTNNVASVDVAFKQATVSLNQSASHNGVVMKEHQLNGNSTPDSTQDRQVFVTSVLLTH
jgi:hypothetical protein